MAVYHRTFDLEWPFTAEGRAADAILPRPRDVIVLRPPAAVLVPRGVVSPRSRTRSRSSIASVSSWMSCHTLPRERSPARPAAVPAAVAPPDDVPDAVPAAVAPPDDVTDDGVLGNLRARRRRRRQRVRAATRALADFFPFLFLSSFHRFCYRPCIRMPS